MKTFLFSLCFLGLSAGLMAQTTSPGMSGEVHHYTWGDLDKMSKLDLTAVYIQEIQKLNQILPYCAFNQKGEATSLSNMGVPGTRDNNATIKKLDASIAELNETLIQTLSDVIPYSDKEEIIKSIIYIQGVIERLEAGI